MINTIDLTTGSIFGLCHIVAFIGIATSVFLFVLSALVFRADPTDPKNRFMGMMLITEAITAGVLPFFWLYPWSAAALPVLFKIRFLNLFAGGSSVRYHVVLIATLAERNSGRGREF